MNEFEEYKDLIVRMISALYPGVKIILFGSRALGTHRETSDIDIALDLKRKMSGLEIVMAKNVLEAVNIPYSIDIVDINSIPPAMSEDILKTGIIWKN